MVRTGARCRPARGVLFGALAGLLLTGCVGGNPPPTASSSVGSTITITEGTRTATRSMITTVTSTAVAQPPPATPEPEPVVADCPYLADDQVADINGQRTGVTTVIDVAPYPICTFARSDGGWLATVRVVQADSPSGAVAAVDQHVPVDGSDPADDPAGWTGGSLTSGDRSTYAVAKGTVAVIAEANQPLSIKGRQLAVAVITNLGL